MRERDTDEAISKRLGRHRNWLERLKTTYPQVYDRMFSYHENRNRSIRLYSEDLKKQQELIRNFKDTFLFKYILSQLFDSKSVYMFTQTLYGFLNNENNLVICDPRTLINVDKIVNLYTQTIEEHIEYVKNYKDNK